MRYLGLDLGSKTLGIAVSDYTNTIATSVKTIYFMDEDYSSLIEPLKELIKEYDISRYEELMSVPRIYDGRNCYSISDMEQYNVLYASIGRRKINKVKSRVN